jgi:hypothetical protein
MSLPPNDSNTLRVGLELRAIRQSSHWITPPEAEESSVLISPLAVRAHDRRGPEVWLTNARRVSRQ